MTHGITESGFVFELEEEVLDDWELLECFCAIDQGDMTSMVKMLDMLLGPEQRERLKEHVRGKTGRVSSKKMMEEIGEILNKAKSGKNC